jgi:formylmethanofuran dehydrogenase subunit E
MNFVVFGVIAPIAYFFLRLLIKKIVINFLRNAKRNSDIKNMIKCENCGIFISERDIKDIEGKSICNKPECRK